MASFAIVLGTRPEIIKLAGVIDELGNDGFVVHTGQHYDDGLSQVFLDSLGLPAPAHQLALGGLPRGGQIGRGTAELAELFGRLDVAAVIVQGDTNSALAGALAANATDRPLVHVEAGLRSYDRAMPEEHNRVLIDHLADLLAAPTKTAVDNLAREGIAGPQVLRSGNTVVEAVARQYPGPATRQALLHAHGLEPAGFVLATIHRPENTDDPRALSAILAALRALPLPVLLPLHPRTAAAVRRAGLTALLDGLQVVEPISGLDFLGLAGEAALLISDSGGVQEEVTVLGRPLVVVRRSTERPEALVHHATLVGPDGVEQAARAWLSDITGTHRRLAQLPSPYGDGTASAQIARRVRAQFTGSG